MRAVSIAVATLIFIQSTAAVAAPGTYRLLDFGAKCDGVTDDTTPIQNWLNSIDNNTLLEAPPGVCIFRSTLTVPPGGKTAVSIKGAGPYTTVFKYTGSSTISDLIVLGDGVNPYIGWLVQGFQLTSTTTMTAGSGMHVKNVDRSQFRDVIWDGQDGTGNLWNGVWFDQIDEDFIDGFGARARNDAIRLNGAVGNGPKAGLFFMHGKVSASGVGIHQGGAFGGLVVDGTDIISNGTNVVIDTALANEANREVFFGPTSAIDTALSGPAVLINDALSGSMTVSLEGWIATGTASGVDIRHAQGAKIEISSPAIWNFNGDGILIEDPLAQVTISNGTFIHDNSGFGVNATSPTDNIWPGSEPTANLAGAYSANTRVENLNPNNGYKKFSNGQIHQWGIVTFTGAANTILSPPGGNPIALPLEFPNSVEASSIVTSPYGFPNGPTQLTISATEQGKTGLFVNLTSSTTVANPQAVHYDVWGH